MKALDYKQGEWVTIINQSTINHRVISGDRVAMCVSPEPFKLEGNGNTFYVYLSVKGSQTFIRTTVARLEKIPVPMSLTIKELHAIDERWNKFCEGLRFEQSSNRFRALNKLESFPILLST